MLPSLLTVKPPLAGVGTLTGVRLALGLSPSNTTGAPSTLSLLTMLPVWPPVVEVIGVAR